MCAILLLCRSLTLLELLFVDFAGLRPVFVSAVTIEKLLDVHQSSHHLGRFLRSGRSHHRLHRLLLSGHLWLLLLLLFFNHFSLVKANKDYSFVGFAARGGTRSEI